MLRNGFSLAELLLALLILGQIAVFTIPKVLSAQANAQNISVLKETIANINQVVYIGVITRELDQSSNGTYVRSHLNLVKECPTNATTQLCWTQGSDSIAAELTQGGGIMHNGATLSGLNNGCCSSGDDYDIFAIDWNGPAGPNIQGDDQIRMYYCYGTAGCDGDATKHPGTVHPRGGTSKTMYENIFK